MEILYLYFRKQYLSFFQSLLVSLKLEHYTRECEFRKFDKIKNKNNTKQPPFFLPHQNLAKSHHLFSDAKDSKPLNYINTDIREQNIYDYDKKNICHHGEKNGQS